MTLEQMLQEQRAFEAVIADFERQAEEHPAWVFFTAAQTAALGQCPGEPAYYVLGQDGRYHWSGTQHPTDAWSPV